MPLRIGYLVQQFPPEVGAGPARVTELAAEWIAQGAEVTVVTGFPSRTVPGMAYGDRPDAYRGKVFSEEQRDGVRVLRSWLYPSRNSSFAGTLANNISFMSTAAAHALTRMGPVDVLIASSPPFFPHVSGAAARLVRGVPLVLEVRDLWPDYLVGMGRISPDGIATRALFGLESALLRLADRVVVVTESFRRRVAAKGVDPADVDVIPNGVDMERYRAADEQPPVPAIARDGRFAVAYLGGFGAGQDLVSVADAAAILAREAPDVKIVLTGDGPERATVVKRAAALALPNLDITPAIPKDATRAYYNACDVCLAPLADVRIFQETVPSKIFEMMACERPVLASLDGEGRRIVEESGGGLVVRPGDPRAIADGVLRLRAMSAAERAEMGARGRAYVREHYDRRRLAERYLGILTDVARSAVGRRASRGSGTDAA